MANQDRVNFVWAETALTTIPPVPVSEVAYRDTTQTPEQMEVGQQYDTIYNSARHNQLLFLLTSVAKTLCENGIMPFLAGQEYSQYARCIFTDGKLYIASRAILANEQPYPTPGDDSGVWLVEETSENLVPNSRRVIAGTGLTGGGPLSSDVTLSAKLDGKTTQADAGGGISAKDVAIGGNLEDLASARGYLVDEYLPEFPSRTVLSSFDDATTPGNFHVLWNNTTTSAPDGILNKNQYADGVLEVRDNRSASFVSSFARLMQRLTIIGGATRADSARIFVRTQSWSVTREWFPWVELVSYNKFGDGFRNTNGIISVPEYEGATASTAGTSGLVPPAAAGQQESFLTGGGEYKPALGFTPVQQGGGTGQGSDKIYIGYSESGLKAQVDTLDLGNVVTTSAGCTKAPSAALADNATNARNLIVTADGQTAKFNWDRRSTGQPEWVWGGNSAEFGNMYAWNPTNFSVNHATNSGNAWQTTVVPNAAIGDAWQAVPAGGTWIFIVSRNGAGGTGTIAGGTVIQQGVWLAIRIS